VPGVAPHVQTGMSYAELPIQFRQEITAILLLDVIEHIERPERFLADIAEAFPNCRCFIVSVPARQEIWSNYDRHYGHYRRYDRELLAATLREGGLRTKSQRYLFRPLYLAALMLTLLRRPRSVVLSAPRQAKRDRWLANALYGIEKALRPLAVVPGSSLLAIATVARVPQFPVPEAFAKPKRRAAPRRKPAPAPADAAP
jgi:hypothetical protein